MSGELDASARTIGLLPKSSPRMRSSINPPLAPNRQWPSVLKAAVDPPEAEATSPVLTPGRRGVELGILFHLVCVGAIGTMIIAVFFGAGLYSLGNPAEELVSNSWAHKHAGSVSTSLVDAATERVAPGANVPPLIAALPGVLAADPVRSSGRTTPSGQGSQLAAGGKTPGGESEPQAEPTQAQTGTDSDPKRPRNASTELVSGTVTEAPDAMTWVVDDKVVHLWGIRPAPRNRRPSMTSLVDWVRAKGPVNCRKQTHSTRYQCFTAAREDIAEAALIAGVGRAADGASPAYRGAEAQAHRQGKGIWAKS
jgi:hypothetical protein